MVPIQFKELQRRQRARLKGVHCRRSASQLVIPLAGDVQTIQTNRAYDPLFFLTPLSKLLGPIKETKVLTWTIHEAGLEELVSVLETLDMGSIDLRARPESIKEVKLLLESKSHQCQTTKSRSKLILVETYKGTLVSITTQPSPDGETHTVSSDPLRYQELLTLFENS
jgi:hypothetical protein